MKRTRLGDENSLMNFSVLVHDSILQSALLHVDLCREAYLTGLLLEANNAHLEFAIPEILNRRGLDRIWPICSEGEGSGEAQGHSQERFKHDGSVARFRDGVKGAQGCLSINLNKGQ